LENPGNTYGFSQFLKGGLVKSFPGLVRVDGDILYGDLPERRTLEIVFFFYFDGLLFFYGFIRSDYRVKPFPPPLF